MPIRFEDVNLIENSALFDADYVLGTHPDVAQSGMSAAEHYLKVGAYIGRKPGPDFDSAAYLKAYLDVAARGENPLLHFERHGRGEGRLPHPPAPTSVDETGNVTVDVVVPVYDALEDVKACLRSLATTPCGYKLRALVINDGSDAETSQWLREACARLSNDRAQFELIEHAQNCGYTVAVNTGLKASSAPFVVTLNSDTIVTSFWLDGMIRCMKSDTSIGVVGPLSNAASWQNVPDLYGEDGKFAINALPAGTTPEDMANHVRFASRQLYPRSTFVNGFCFTIRRAVLNAVGFMDEAAFPTGYGEENDFCIRAQDAGFALAFADDVYVFHAKSKSFGTARREALSKAGGDALRKKHGERKFADLVARVARTGQMDKVRRRLAAAIADSSASQAATSMRMLTRQKPLFILPVKGGGGGAHSVVQEVTAMRRIGVDARIAVREVDLENFMQLYGDIPEAEDIFEPFRDDTLLGIAQRFDVAVATIFTSMKLVKQIVETFPWILPAYYAQDYEPLFFDDTDPLWQEALDSYGLVPDTLIFAKTVWICREIEANHGLPVTRVEPSIDHEVYGLFGPSVAEPDGTFCITAMIRPRTPRRGAARTMELLARLKARFGAKLTVRIFGCDITAPEFSELPSDFEFIDHGILTRRDVAALLRSADVFVDLSDYQAFGRTGLEAMACGALAVVPLAGGGDEYAVDGVNALVVDSFDVEACFTRLVKTLDEPDQLARMQFAGVQTAASYSPRRAAMSELHAFAPAIARRRALHPKPQRTAVSLLPAALGEDPDLISAPGYARVLCPFQQDALSGHWQMDASPLDHLPEPGTAKVALLQHDLIPPLQDEFESWHCAWKEQGGRLIYELDERLCDTAALMEQGLGAEGDALAERLHRYAAAADLITLSTPHLAQVFAAFADKVMLVPNFLDAKLWQLTEETAAPVVQKPSLRIGCLGQPSQVEDLRVVQEATQLIERKHGIRIEVIGAFETSGPVFGKRVGLPRKRDYPTFVPWLFKVAEWDIALVPAADTPANHLRSNLQFLENAALNAAIICSDVPEFDDIARHGENCLKVAGDTQSWVEAIEKLLSDPAQRARLVAAARADLQSRMTVQSNVDLYRAVLQRALHAE